MNEQITRLHPVALGAMSKRLSDAQIRAEIARQARLKAGEPEQYWVNFWWDQKDGTVEPTVHDSKPVALEEISAGYPHLDYLYTLDVTKAINPLMRDVLAASLTDEAAASERDRENDIRLEQELIDSVRADWEASR